MVVLIFDSTGHFDTFEITNVQSPPPTFSIAGRT